MSFFQISPNFYFFFDYFDPESKLAIFYKIPKNMTLFHINIYKYEESWSESWPNFFLFESPYIELQFVD